MTLSISGFKGAVRTPVELNNINSLYKLLPNHQELPRKIESAWIAHEDLQTQLQALAGNKFASIEITGISYTVDRNKEVKLDVVGYLKESVEPAHYELRTTEGRQVLEFYQFNDNTIQFIGGIPKNLKLHGLIVWSDNLSVDWVFEPTEKPVFEDEFSIPSQDVIMDDRGEYIAITVPMLGLLLGTEKRRHVCLATRQALTAGRRPRYKHMQSATGSEFYNVLYKGKALQSKVQLVERFHVYA